MKFGFLILLFSSAAIAGCSKSGDNNPAAPQEQAITFMLDATNNSVSTGNSFAFNVTLTSTMPASGIKIDVTTTDQATNSIVQNQTFTSNSGVTALTATNLVQQHWNLVNVKVTSVSVSTNSASKSFTVAYK